MSSCCWEEGMSIGQGTSATPHSPIRMISFRLTHRMIRQGDWTLLSNRRHSISYRETLRPWATPRPSADKLIHARPLQRQEQRIDW